MHIVKKIVIKSTISLFVSITSVIGTQVGVAIWNSGLGDKVENRTRHLFKTKKEEFA